MTSIEQAMQLRWQDGATESLAPMPLLGMTLPMNPTPQPFRASLIAEIMGGATKLLEGSKNVSPQIL